MIINLPKQSAIPSKGRLKEMLEDHIVQIEFIKKDGEDRIMMCTRSPLIIPYETKSEKKRVDVIEKEDHLRVWDVEAHGWRIVTLSTIKKISEGVRVINDLTNRDQ